MVTADEVRSLRVVDLKAELKARGLSTTGLKAELAERLTEGLQAEAGQQQPEEAKSADGDKLAADAEPAAAVQAGEEPVGDAAAGKAAEVPAAEPAAVASMTPAEEPVEAAIKEAEAAAKSAADVDDPVEAPAETAPAEAHVPSQAPEADAEASAAAEPAVDAAAPAEVAIEAEMTPAAEPAQVAAELASAAELSAAEPTAAAEAASPAEYAEPLLEDEAPEMDFDVEPEEDVIEAATKAAASEAAKSADGKSPGKRGREPIPGFKAPGKIETTRRDSEGERPSKLQRSENGVTPRRATAASDIPAATPQSRGGVPVPLPNMTPTAALRIDGFMRPFTLPQATELLSQEGAVLKEFWMNSIKTHCFAIFETAEQAEAIRQATYNMRWPRDSLKRLSPKFVVVDEAEAAIANNGVTPRAETTPREASQSTPPAGTPKGTDARKEILERRQLREVAGSSGRKPAREQKEPEALTLDDLFRKTETEPHLYWLPVAKPPAKKTDAAVTAAAESEVSL